jgi:hypothetical protein
MRNVWKGLVVGAFTGVVAGYVLDTLAAASKKAQAAGANVRAHAPDAGRWLLTAKDKAGDRLHDADVPEHVRDVAQRVTDSDAAHQVKKAGIDLMAAAREAVADHHG